MKLNDTHVFLFYNLIRTTPFIIMKQNFVFFFFNYRKKNNYYVDKEIELRCGVITITHSLSL